jgi:hypothetical protein
MPDYRAFIVSPDGHFDRFVPLDCANDDAAIEQAKQLVDGHDVSFGIANALSSILSVGRNKAPMLTAIDRKELERRLAQARRMAKEPTDPLTHERLEVLVVDLEHRLKP